MENQSFYNHLLTEEARVKELLVHIQGLIKYYRGINTTPITNIQIYRDDTKLGNDTPKSHQSNLFQINPNEYNKRAIVPEKVLFALKVVGSGTSREVGLKLRELDGAYTEEKAIDDARFHLSSLAKDNKIIAKNIPGMRGYIYEYKTEEAPNNEAS